MDFDFDFQVDSLKNFDFSTGDADAMVKQFNDSFKDSESCKSCELSHDGKQFTFTDAEGKTYTSDTGMEEKMKSLDDSIKGKVSLADSKISKDAIEEAKKPENIEKSSKNADSLKDDGMKKELWDGIKKLFKLGVAGGIGYWALTEWADAKTGCYGFQGTTPTSRIFKMAGNADIGNAMCKCGKLFKNPNSDSHPSDNSSVNAECQNLSGGDYCSSLATPITQCQLPPKSTITPIYLKYKVYTVGDALGNAAAAVGKTIDATGKLVDAIPDVLTFIIKYWWLILIFLIVILIFIGVIMHLVTRG